MYYAIGSGLSLSIFLLGNVIYSGYDKQFRENLQTVIPPFESILNFFYGDITPKLQFDEKQDNREA